MTHKIDKRNFELWLEFEHWQKEGNDPEDDIFNMEIRCFSGRTYSLNVWTYKALERITLHLQESGECLNGAYLLPPDLFVKRLDRHLIEKVVDELISLRELKKEWEVPSAAAE